MTILIYSRESHADSKVRLVYYSYILCSELDSEFRLLKGGFLSDPILQQPSPAYRKIFRQPYTIQAIAESQVCLEMCRITFVLDNLGRVQGALSRAFEPYVHQMLAHIDSCTILKAFETDFRTLCGTYLWHDQNPYPKLTGNKDLCKASIFASSYFCSACHYEICPMCMKAPCSQVDVTREHLSLVSATTSH